MVIIFDALTYFITHILVGALLAAPKHPHPPQNNGFFTTQQKVESKPLPGLLSTFLIFDQ
jgi:hypothetical protein